MHRGQWREQRTTIGYAVLIAAARAAALTNPRNICFFCPMSCCLLPVKRIEQKYPRVCDCPL